MTMARDAGASREPGLAQVEAAVRGYRRTPMRIEGFRAAAVLVPVVERAGGLELLFTVRSAGLASHAGQICFPGGRLEPGEDAIDAALRETREEIGVRVERAAVFGLLDDHPSPAGYVATPVVARVDPSVRPTLDPAEVAEVFAAPVADLREIAPSWEERRLERYRRRIHFYPWNGRLIWGFTGNVLKDFLDVTAASAVAPGATGPGA